MPVILSEGGQPSVKSLRGWVRLHDFGLRGVRLQDFLHEAPENGAEGAVLEIFCDFECGKWLKCLKML